MQNNGKIRKINGKDQISSLLLNFQKVREVQKENKSEKNIIKNTTFNNTISSLNKEILNLSIDPKKDKIVDFDATVYVNRINSDFEVTKSYSTKEGEDIKNMIQKRESNNLKTNTKIKIQKKRSRSRRYKVRNSHIPFKTSSAEPNKVNLSNEKTLRTRSTSPNARQNMERKIHSVHMKWKEEAIRNRQFFEAKKSPFFKINKKLNSDAKNKLTRPETEREKKVNPRLINNKRINEISLNGLSPKKHDMSK